MSHDNCRLVSLRCCLQDCKKHQHRDSEIDNINSVSTVISHCLPVNIKIKLFKRVLNTVKQWSKVEINSTVVTVRINWLTTATISLNRNLCKSCRNVLRFYWFIHYEMWSCCSMFNLSDCSEIIQAKLKFYNFIPVIMMSQLISMIESQSVKLLLNNSQ